MSALETVEQTILDEKTGIYITPSRDDNLSDFSRATFDKVLLRQDETPQYGHARAARAWSAEDMELAQRLYTYASRGWMMWASPLLSNAPLPGEKLKAMPISCLTGDMPINTARGMKWMEDIRVGDRVLTHKGRYRSVEAIKTRMSSDDLYELKVASRTTAMKITGNHPVLTNMGWVRVDELDAKQHFVAVNGKIEHVEKEHVIVTPEATKHGIPGAFERKSIPNEIHVDDDVAWAIGLWLAEGSHMKNNKGEVTGIRITLNVNEHHLADRWLSIIASKFGIVGSKGESSSPNRRDLRKTNKWLNANASGKEIADLFEREFGRGCKVKSFPEWVMNLPKSRLASLLEAFAEGDGCDSHDATVITLANPYLLGGLYNITLKLGYNAACNFTVKGRGENYIRRYVYSLRICKYRGSYARHSTNSGIPFHDGLIYCPIRSLRKLPQNETVYDIQVAEDESFSVSGVVVHNCFLTYVPDTIDGLLAHLDEMNRLTIAGGGVGGHWSDIRAVGKGKGSIPHMHVVDACMDAFAQGPSRRGSYAAYQDVEHSDGLEFIGIRIPTDGDKARKCHGKGFHHGINLTDAFMRAVLANEAWDLKCPNSGEVKDTLPARMIWETIIKTRVRIGEPYIHYIDTANRALPETHKKKGLKIRGSNLCAEIELATDEERTAVCCLSSLNMDKYDEWKDTTIVEDMLTMLDNVLSYFIKNADRRLTRAIYSATMSRDVGLGMMGFHSYLQRHSIPFESEEAREINKRVFNQVKSRAEAHNLVLGAKRGEAPDMEGTGKRFSHMLAVAPNATSSIVLDVSPSIEPWNANVFKQNATAGSYRVINPHLLALLKKLGKATDEILSDITRTKGSVQHLDFLTDHEKKVFKTARELDQRWIVQHAGDRAPILCQGQSVNLFFKPDEDAAYVSDVHILAWILGVKSLYYLRSRRVGDAKVGGVVERIALDSVIGKKGCDLPVIAVDIIEPEETECLSCHG